MIQYFPELIQGLHASLMLTALSMIISLILSLIFSSILILRIPILIWIVHSYTIFFTGTPLLTQIFLIYYGLGQSLFLQKFHIIWNILSEPWFCAIIALSLNSAAYTTQLFYGTFCTIPANYWQSCSALGMNKRDTLVILFPYVFKRALPSYSNEILLIFKSTSLTCTITIMEIMGHCQLLYGRTYDIMVFCAAGIIYLIVTSFLTFFMHLIERKALLFERKN